MAVVYSKIDQGLTQADEEMEFCTNIEYLWIKDLPLIIYEPKLAPTLS